MHHNEPISQLEGILIVAKEEGAQLGKVSGIFMDPALRKLAAVTFRPHSIGPMHFVPVEEIAWIGHDVLFLSRKGASHPYSGSDHPNWRPLKDIQGLWVTTQDGTHLGVVLDVEIDPKAWTIAELSLADGHFLPVKPEEIVIGLDEVIVPSSYRAHLKGAKAEAKGLLARVVGRETIEELGGVLRRALKRVRLQPERPAERPKSTPKI
jgi:sporulation protein YlmC with PRC-barrel domain